MEHRSKSSDPAGSRSVHLALDVLELLVADGRPVGPTEIATRIGGPKATVHRLLSTLLSRGYLRQEPRSGGYTVGVRCLELGSSWTQEVNLRATATSALAELNAATDETVHLAVYDSGEIVYVEKIDSPLPVVARSHIGRRCPAFCVATGRALLAYQSPEEIADVLGRPLPVFTPHTITDRGALTGMLAEVRERGYAVNHESYRDGVGGIAAAIKDYTGAVVASVGCCVPEHRFGADRFAVLRDRTIAAAQEISTRLGSAIGRPHTKTAQANDR